MRTIRMFALVSAAALAACNLYFDDDAGRTATPDAAVDPDGGAGDGGSHFPDGGSGCDGGIAPDGGPIDGGFPDAGGPADGGPAPDGHCC